MALSGSADYLGKKKARAGFGFAIYSRDVTLQSRRAAVTAGICGCPCDQQPFKALSTRCVLQSLYPVSDLNEAFLLKRTKAEIIDVTMLL